MLQSRNEQDQNQFSRGLKQTARNDGYVNKS